MCGIAGLKYPSDEVPGVHALDAILNSPALRRRGPDASGVFCSNGTILGMNRLSILDLSSGNQPIYNENRTIAVIQNGEIYNYLELKQLLEGKGHKFSTTSDTEVIVHGYEEWGEEVFSHLRGMFAIAIHDMSLKRTFVARDRLGIKPLFYYKSPKLFVFASDLLALIEHPKVPRELNQNMLWRYLSYGYPVGPETFLKNIYQLEPGSYLCIDAQGEVLQKYYWQLKYPSQQESDRDDRSVSQIVDGLKKHVIQAVERQMVSDVPLGAFLSGGLDSSTVVWAMAQVSNSKPEVFSVGFNEPSYDESHHAQRLAEHFGVKWNCIRLADPSPEEFDQVLRLWDQPHFDFSAYPTYYLSKFAREKVKVALTGGGGDEILGGYPTYVAGYLAKKYQTLPTWLRNKVIKPLVDSLPASHEYMSFEFKAKSFVRGADASPDVSHYAWKILFREDEKYELLRSSDREVQYKNDPQDIVKKYFSENQHASLLDQMLYADAKTFLVDNGLYKVDRMTMAASLEARVPLLDEDLVAFANAIPGRYKVRGLSTKWILRQMMKPNLPEVENKLPKRGFTPPFAKWINASLNGYVKSQLLDNSSLDRFFNREIVNKILEEHNNLRADHSRKISALLAFLNWHSRVLG